MLVRIHRGPKYGQTCHVPKSQEIQTLIMLGDLEVVEDNDPLVAENTRALQAQPQYTPGWSVVLIGPEQKPAILFIDASGTKTFYEAIPGKQRVWRYDAATETEGYEFVDSGCPQTVIEKFRTMTSQVINPETASELKRIERQQLESAMAAQQSSGHNLW